MQDQTWDTPDQLPPTLRISLVYRNLDVHYEAALNQNSTKYFFASYCKPSTWRYTKHLRKVNKEALCTLSRTPLDTYVPDVGYRTKHARCDDVVYVLQGHDRGEMVRDESRPQDYVMIIKEVPMIYIWDAGKSRRDATWEERFVNVCRNTKVKKRYIDKLTKKQKDALAVLCVMDTTAYVEGIGYRAERTEWLEWDEEKQQSRFRKCPVYFLEA